MKTTIESLLAQAITVKQKALQDDTFIAAAERATEMIAAVIEAGGTIYLCGNGGSAADAIHFSEELVARYKRERPGVRAMHFMDPGVLTCWSNDYSFDSVFERQADVYCTDKDVLIGFSTSGNSKNVLAAFDMAGKKRCKTILFAGKDGGAGKSKADLALIVPAQETERIQEVHITLVHIICEILETQFAATLGMK